MESQDPYRPPEADLLRPPPSFDDQITPRMIEILAKTRPWVLLMAILGFIVAGLMVIGGIVLAVAVSVSGENPAAALLGLVYIVFSLIYIFPCYYLLKFAGAAKALSGGGGASAMEEALERQYSFWRLVGIMAVVLLALYALILVGAIAFGLFGALSG